MPNLLPNNYNWKTWNDWFSSTIRFVSLQTALSSAEKQPIRGRRINRLFSVVFTRSSQSPLISFSLIPSNGPAVLTARLQLTDQQMHLSFPLLQGVALQDSPVYTLDQLVSQLRTILSPPIGSGILTVLLCYAINKEILSALQLDSIPQLVVRDVGRVPLYTPSLHIAQSLHSLFVTPSTPLTLPNSLTLLTEYLRPLHLTTKWIDIPIPSQPAIHWVRYELLQGVRPCLVGYVRPLISIDSSASCATSRECGSEKPSPCCVISGEKRPRCSTAVLPRVRR